MNFILRERTFSNRRIGFFYSSAHGDEYNPSQDKEIQEKDE